MNSHQRRTAASRRRNRRQTRSRSLPTLLEVRFTDLPQDFSNVGHGLDCGCHTRVVVPLEPTICPECGVRSHFIPQTGLPYPTSAEPGSVMTLQVGCFCGNEYDLQVAVE